MSIICPLVYTLAEVGAISAPTNDTSWASTLASFASATEVTIGNAEALGGSAVYNQGAPEVVNYSATRGFFCFDTRAVTGSVDSAVLHCYINVGVEGARETGVFAWTKTPEDPPLDLVEGDAVKVGSVSFGTIPSQVFGYHAIDLSLNTAGKTHINIGGYTFFSYRMDWDYNGAPAPQTINLPPWVGEIKYSSMDMGGNVPTLEVTELIFELTDYFTVGKQAGEGHGRYTVLPRKQAFTIPVKDVTA